LNIRENLKRIVDMENLRNRGFNTAINSITSILDTSKMGYQYIENLKNARELIIREYEDTDVANLPDERYQIKLKYMDNAQLIEERKAYDVQLKSFETEVHHIWDIIHVIYEESKRFGRVYDFNDLANKKKKRIKAKKDKTGEPLYQDIDKVWDEIAFVKPAETEVERSNRTYIYEKNRVSQQIILMRKKLKAMYAYQYPIERRVIEDRLNFMEREYSLFAYKINPYHIQPGIILDIDITSIKRKKATLNSMANVLNEFLHGVSKGFQDAAFAAFSRRRSTVREDISQSFSSGMEDNPAVASSAYLDILNTGEDAPVSALADLAGKGRGPKAKPGRVAKAGKPGAKRGRSRKK